MTDSVPDNLSATEQSILISSVASKTTLPPERISSEDPAGIVTSLIRNDVPLFTLLAPPLFAVSQSRSRQNLHLQALRIKCIRWQGPLPQWF